MLLNDTMNVNSDYTKVLTVENNALVLRCISPFFICIDVNKAKIEWHDNFTFLLIIN